MLSVDLSSFASDWLSGFFELLVQSVSVLNSTIVCTINGTQITAWDFVLGGFVLSLTFGLFVWLSPLMKGGNSV